MIQSTKNHCNNSQDCNKADDIKEELGALIYQLNPPIVKELNSTSDFTVLSLTTVSGAVYERPKNLTPDTWTGTVSFKQHPESRFSIILDGNQIESIVIECPET